MQLIQLTVVSRRGVAKGSPSWVFDLEDMLQPLEDLNPGTGTTIFLRESRSGFAENQSDNFTAVTYVVAETIAAINVLNPDIIPAHVVTAKGRPLKSVSKLRGFHTKQIVGPVIPFNGGSKFLYQSGDDPVAAEYVVTETPAAFISSSSGFNCASAITCIQTNILKYYREDSVAPIVTPVANNKSVAIGDGAVATTGGNSIAVGATAVATGTASLALGKLNTASGTRAYAVGSGNSVASTDSGAFGSNNSIGGGLTDVYAIGLHNIPTHSHAYLFGENLTSSGPSTVGIGITDANKVIIDANGNLNYGGTTGQLMPNGIGGAAGYILQANGPGIADTWVDPSTIAAPSWQLGGNGLIGIQNFGTVTAIDVPMIANGVEIARLCQATGFMAVGLTVATAKLHVSSSSSSITDINFRVSAQNGGIADAFTVSAEGEVSINSIPAPNIITAATNNIFQSLQGGYYLQHNRNQLSFGDVTFKQYIGLIGSGFTSLGNYSNHDLRIRTNNVDVMSITNAGWVGLGAGNIAPSSNFHLKGNASGTTAHALFQNISGASSLELYDNGAAQFGFTGYAGSTGRVFVKASPGDPFNWGIEIYNTRTSGVPIGLRVTLDGNNVGSENRGIAIDVTNAGGVANALVIGSGNMIMQSGTQASFGYSAAVANTLIYGRGIGTTSATASLRLEDHSGNPVAIFLDNGQVGLGNATPATSAALDITSTTGALLVPRMNTTQRTALTPSNGMIVYDTTLDSFYKYQAGAWAAF